jgi:hypothetical protein
MKLYYTNQPTEERILILRNELEEGEYGKSQDNSLTYRRLDGVIERYDWGQWYKACKCHACSHKWVWVTR